MLKPLTNFSPSSPTWTMRWMTPHRPIDRLGRRLVHVVIRERFRLFIIDNGYYSPMELSRIND